MKGLLVTILLLSQFAFAGGGEGSMGGGAGKIIGEMMEMTRYKNYLLEVPTLKLKGKSVKVIDTCIDNEDVRTYDVTDNYPEFVDIYNIPQGVAQKKSSLRLRSKYTVSLFRKIDIDNANMKINTKMRERKVDYRIPVCH